MEILVSQQINGETITVSSGDEFAIGGACISCDGVMSRAEAMEWAEITTDIELVKIELEYGETVSVNGGDFDEFFVIESV